MSVLTLVDSKGKETEEVHMRAGRCCIFSREGNWSPSVTQTAKLNVDYERTGLGWALCWAIMFWLLIGGVVTHRLKTACGSREA